jgi:Family of unknown function (DUF5652)
MQNLLSNPLPNYVIALIAVLGIWEAVWKAIALWRAGRDHRLVWFIVMFVLNTVGILEIIYIFAVSRPGRARENAGK